MPPDGQIMALSDVAIKQAKPQAKTQKLADGGGLYLEVTPAGGKLWRYKYRYGGKEKRLALGAYPEISLKDARERHLQARKLIADGIDPGEHRKAVKIEQAKIENNTFRIWGDKWHQYWKAGKSERHTEYVKRRLETDIYPIIGDLPITAINAPEIVRTVKSIANRGALEMAKKAHQHIGQIFRYAIAHGDESDVTRNPANDIKPSDIIETRRKVNYAQALSQLWRVRVRGGMDCLKAKITNGSKRYCKRVLHGAVSPAQGYLINRLRGMCGGRSIPGTYTG